MMTVATLNMVEVPRTPIRIMAEGIVGGVSIPHQEIMTVTIIEADAVVRGAILGARAGPGAEVLIIGGAVAVVAVADLVLVIDIEGIGPHVTSVVIPFPLKNKSLQSRHLMQRCHPPEEPLVLHLNNPRVLKP